MAHQSNPNDTTKILSYILVALIAFAGGYLVKRLTGPTTAKDGTQAEADQGSAAAPSAGDSDSAGDAKIPIGDSPTQGPDDAKVTIVEFSDFECPFCEKGYKRIEKLKKNYPDDVKVVFKHYPLPFHKNAKPAARAAMAAGEQGEEYFWKMHDRLFEKQSEWKKADVQKVASKWAKDMGMDAEKFKTDMKENKDRYNEIIQRDMDMGKKLGVKGTPHFFVNGEGMSGAQPYNRFKSVVEDKLDQADKLLEGSATRSNLYEKAVAKNYDGGNKKPDKKKKKKKKKQKVEYVPVDDDDPTKGASADEAMVTFVEFSDFQCPFCNKAKPTVAKLRKNFGDKVRFAFKHRPLSFHKQAKPAAKAAIAAQKQGKFWEMYDVMFSNQKKLKQGGAFEKWAEQIGLNVEKFKTDMESDETQKILQGDIDAAKKVGANGTPNFWVNGVQITGAQPYNKFKSVVEQQIEKAEKLKEEKGLSGDKLYKAVVEANKDDIGGSGSGSAGKDKPSPKKKDAPKVDTSKLKIGDAPTKGPEDAPITMYAFSEFQCPYCKKAKPQIDKVMENYEGKVQLVFKHYPLPFHNQAKPAAKAAISAQKQGKFWEMHDLMFENQSNLKQDGIYEQWAEQLGLNVEKFKKDMKNVPESEIQDDMKMGKSVGVKGTPAFFINGKRLVGAQPYNKFKSIIDEELNN
jgi:protein-disulfide isomerase